MPLEYSELEVIIEKIIETVRADLITELKTISVTPKSNPETAPPYWFLVLVQSAKLTLIIFIRNSNLKERRLNL